METGISASHPAAVRPAVWGHMDHEASAASLAHLQCLPPVRWRWRCSPRRQPPPSWSSSPWNVPAAQKGTITQGNPYASLFTSYDPGLVLGGGPAGSSSHDHGYAKPIFQASPGDPCRTVLVRNPDWAFGNVEYFGECVPVPRGVQAATGSDGHLEVVSADGTKSWAMWRCKQGSDSGTPCSEANVLAGRYQVANMAVWDRTGLGVADCCRNATGKARGRRCIRRS